MYESQSRAILKLLIEAKGEWVSLPRILCAQGPRRVITSHTRRIKDLREQGFDIQNKVENNGRHKFSSYRIPVRPGEQVPMSI